MKREYPDYLTYRKLYRRYYAGRDVAELLQLLEPLHGTRLLDLCAGEGQLALKALQYGARSAVAVDAAEAMISPALRQNEQIKVVVGTVHEALGAMRTRGELFDRVACRQAINYWLDKEAAELVARVLPPGGLFAFNTFNQKPCEKPRVLQYELQRRTYVEVSWLVGKTVHHLQVREGLKPHYTSFQWLSSKQLREMLEPHFIVAKEERGKTSLYQCIKR